MIDKEALIRIREAKSLSQGALAKLSGCSQQLIGALESGGTLTTKFLPKIAAALEVAPGELDSDWSGVKQPEPAAPRPGAIIPGRELVGATKDLPVYASAEGGSGEIIRSTEAVDWIPRPSNVQHIPEAYGLIITGTSMVPEFEPGDTAVVNPRFPIIGETTCIFYRELHGEARASIKRLIRTTSTDWNVRQWNPPPGMKADFTLSRREWGICHRVLGKHYRQ